MEGENSPNWYFQVFSIPYYKNKNQYKQNHCEKMTEIKDRNPQNQPFLDCSIANHHMKAFKSKKYQAIEDQTSKYDSETTTSSLNTLPISSDAPIHAFQAHFQSKNKQRVNLIQNNNFKNKYLLNSPKNINKRSITTQFSVSSLRLKSATDYPGLKARQQTPKNNHIYSKIGSINSYKESTRESTRQKHLGNHKTNLNKFKNFAMENLKIKKMMTSSEKIQNHKTSKDPQPQSIDKLKNIVEPLHSSVDIQEINRNFSLDQFTLISKIGKGSLSQVYSAMHKQTRMLFALKIIKKQSVKNNKLQHLIIRQIQNNHSVQKQPNIVGFYSSFYDQHYIYMVMEYMPLGSLYDYWNKSKVVSERIVKKIMRDICNGLKSLHDHNIIHRDIKLENILLSYNVCKIGDLGCSVRSSRKRNSCLGSLQYLSPQQLKGQKYDDKIDMWSLGIIAFELVFGCSPFKQEIQSMMRNKQLSKWNPLKFPDNIQVSQPCLEFISGLLETDPMKRMSAGQALEHQFLTINQ